MGYSFQELEKIWIQAGGNPDQAANAAAIALAESAGNPGAIGDNGDSVGLWQIDTYYHPGLDYQDLKNPIYNAQQAIKISGDGQNWTPWSTYCTSGNGVNCQNPGYGAYRKYLNGETPGLSPTPIFGPGGSALSNLPNELNQLGQGIESIAGGIVNGIGNELQALFGGLVSPFLRLPQSLINIGWNFSGFAIGICLIFGGLILLALASLEDIAGSVEKAVDNMQNAQANVQTIKNALPEAAVIE